MIIRLLQTICWSGFYDEMYIDVDLPGVPESGSYIFTNKIKSQVRHIEYKFNSKNKSPDSIVAVMELKEMHHLSGRNEYNDFLSCMRKEGWIDI